MTAPLWSVCPRCGEAHPSVAYEACAEPWTALYDLAVWQRARAAVRSRDGACVVCGETAKLQVDHVVPLWELWEVAERHWGTFVTLATDLDLLEAVCPLHHAQRERARRRSVF